MDTLRVSQPVPTESLGPGGRTEGGCANPLPSSPAPVIWTGESNGSRTRTSFAKSRGSVGVCCRCATMRRNWWFLCAVGVGVVAVFLLESEPLAPIARSSCVERVTGVDVESALSAWEEFSSSRSSLSCNGVRDMARPPDNDLAGTTTVSYAGDRVEG